MSCGIPAGINDASLLLKLQPLEIQINQWIQATPDLRFVAEYGGLADLDHVLVPVISGAKTTVHVVTHGGADIGQFELDLNRGAVEFLVKRHSEYKRLVRLANPSPPFSLRADLEGDGRLQPGATARVRVRSDQPAFVTVLVVPGVHTVCAAGDAAALAAGLKRDASLATAKDGAGGWTPILYACASPLHSEGAKSARGILRCAEILLDAGVDVDSHTLFDEGDAASKLTTLYRACMSNHVALVKLLLERGEDPNDGESIYHAAQLNRVACLELLLDHGADPNLARADGRTPWVIAVRSGHPAALDLLRARGAKPTGVSPIDELVGACRRGDAKAARATLAANPGLLMRLGDEDRAALALAAEAGREDAVRTMVALGFELQWENTCGGTALHHAAWRGNVSLTRALLSLGAPVNFRDKQYGSSPIGWAAHGSQFCGKAKAADYCAIVDALLDAGADRDSAINKWNMAPESMASPRVEAHLRQRGFAPPRKG